jgi:hypothetical protein
MHKISADPQRIFVTFSNCIIIYSQFSALFRDFHKKQNKFDKPCSNVVLIHELSHVK